MGHEIKIYRSFIAFSVPVAVVNGIKLSLNTLKSSLAENSVRWVPPNNLHLTLAFLGNQPEQKLNELWNCLEHALEGEKQVESAVTTLAGFPDAKSSIVAGLIEPTESLLYIQKKVASCCIANHIELDKRTFKPHITLGRVPRGKRVRVSNTPCQLSVAWSQLSIFTSRVTPEGSLYSELYSLDLSK